MFLKSKIRINTKSRRTRLIFVGAIIVVLSGFVYAGLVLRKNAEAAWSPNHTLWAKRKQIPVINNSADSLAANIPIAVTIDTKSLVNQGKLQSDCDDLRVLYQPNSTTATELDRFLSYPGGATCSTSEATKVYFKLQSTLSSAATSTDYYMYYTNDQATAPSNSDNAFDVGSNDAILVCPFDGTTTCAAGETPTTATGAIRYSGSKSALSFQAGQSSPTHDFATVSGDLGTNLTQITFEAWVNQIDNLTNVPGIISRDTRGNCTYSSGLYQNFGLGITFDLDIGGSCRTTGDYDIGTGWHHVAGVYDGSYMKLYIDGVMQKSTAVTGTFSAGGSNWRIGDTGFWNQGWTGYIDEVRVSDIARYSSNFTPSTSPFARDEHTKLLLHFDENGDDPRNTGKAIDDSGNGNHATLGANTTIGIDDPMYVTGFVGVDASTSETGNTGGANTYAGHEGIFFEAGTTNKITNPSFENATYDTNWTASASATLTANTTAPFYKFGSKSAKAVVSGGDATLLTSINVGNTNRHTLSVYVFDGTTNSIGGQVTSSIAQLMFNATPVTTTYTDMGGGWWRLSAAATGVNASSTYGVTVKDTKTVYVDAVQLEEVESTVNYATSYTDGSLGTGYAWNGTANNSTSTRTTSEVSFSSALSASDTTGSVSVWYKPNFNEATSPLDGYDRFGAFQIGNGGWGWGNGFIVGAYSDTWQPATSVTFSAQGFGTGTNGANVDVLVTKNNWYHLVYVWNGTTHTLYVNNTSSGAQTFNTHTDTGNFYIGNPPTGASPYSTISDLRVYDSVLSAGEATDLYYSGLVSHSDAYEVDRFSGNKGQDPVGTYHFDEGYGTTAQDSSPYDNDLTLYGPTWETQSEATRARLTRNLKFDGTNDVASSSAETSKDYNFGAESFSISGWFRHTSTITGTDTILAKYKEAGYKVYMNSGGNICFGIDQNATFDGDIICSTSGTYNDSRWHHFEAVKDAVASIKIYIDSNLVNTDSSIGNSGTLNNTSGMFVGADSDNSNYWTGFLDELIIYPYARSASQVKEDMAGGQTGEVFGTKTEDFLTEGLVSYWKMDEATGTSATDSSGNGNTGTLTNMQETGTAQTGGSTTTLVGDTSLVNLDDAYNNDIIEITGGSCGITVGTSRQISDYTGSSRTITVATAWSAVPDACTYSIDHQINAKFGNGVEFDGVDDSIEATGHDIKNFTFSVWFNPYKFQGSTYNPIYAVDNRFILWYYANELYLYIIRSGGNDVYSCTTGNTINTWRHVVVSYNDEIKQARIYQNGALVCTSTGSNNILTSSSTTSVFGRQQSGSTYRFEGIMDEVRLYNRALTPVEVSQLYNFAPGPVGHWKMDEGSGTSAADSSGNGKTGTFSGSPSWTQGKYGNGLKLDGLDDYVNTSLITNNFVTIEGWVDFSDPDSLNRIDKYHSLFGWGGEFSLTYRTFTEEPGAGYFLRLDANTQNGSTDNADILYILPTLLTGWHHLAATYDGLASKLYIDGVKVGSTNAPDTGILQNNYVFRIGYDDLSSYYSDNAIDDVRVYYYVRSPAQIVEDMNAGHPAPGSPVGSSLLAYKFDEGYGDTANNTGSQGPTYNGDLAGSCPGAATCPSWSNDGKYGKALNFDGGDWVVGPDLDFATGPFSISAWFKTSSLTAGQRIVSKVFTTNDNYDIFVTSNGYVSAVVQDSAGDQQATNSFKDYRDGNWHLATLVVTSSEVLIYVDGRLGLTTDTHNNTLSTHDVHFQVGASTEYAAYFNGSIDEVKAYNTALTAEQVKVEYNQGKSTVFGATSTDSGGIGTWSDTNAFCPPGQGSTCTPPVGEWKFDEKTGTSAYDTAGNGNTGTLTNGPTWQPAGICKFGSCLDFDGNTTADDRIDSGSGTTIDDIFNGGGTVTYWIKPRSEGELNTGRHFDKSGVNNGWMVNNQPCDATYVDLNMAVDTAGTDGQWRVDCVLIRNQWNYVTVVYNDDSSTNDPSFYVNGVLQSLDLDTNSSGYVSDAGNNLYFGSTAGSSSVHDGLLDQIRFYDYSRTQAQISWEYNQGGPVGWWKLDECSTTIANDSSGNGNNGTITPGASGNTAAGSCNSGISTEMWNNGTTGKISASLDFDGTDDYVNIGDISTYDFGTGQSFSIEAWINRDTFNSFDTVVAKDDDVTNLNGDGFTISVRTQDDVQFEVGYGAGNIGSAISEIKITSTGWYHIVGVLNRENSTIKTYVNGKEEASGSLVGGFGPDNALDLRIGSESDGGEPFDGKIDNVRIYRYALTSQQVKVRFNEGAVHFGN